MMDPAEDFILSQALDVAESHPLDLHMFDSIPTMGDDEFQLSDIQLSQAFETAMMTEGNFSTCRLHHIAWINNRLFSLSGYRAAILHE